MNFKYYAAPINMLSNKIYRHILLKHKADFVFSELIRIDKIDQEINKDKLEIISGDENKTIWQIGVSCKEEIDKAIQILKKKHKFIFEININMGCPHSSLEKRKYCSGILNDTKLMRELSGYLAKRCEEEKILSSVKIRIGTRNNPNRIKEYLDILNKSKINKVYIHLRYLTYNYTKPALYDFLEESINHRNKNYDNKKLNLNKYKFEIILNGDIDTYEKCLILYKKFKIKSFMIGRASVHNPLIFEDLKNKVENKTNEFNPIENNINLVKKNMSTFLSERQKKVINELIFLSKKHKSREEILKSNLSWILKGIDKKEKNTILKTI